MPLFKVEKPSSSGAINDVAGALVWAADAAEAKQHLIDISFGGYTAFILNTFTVAEIAPDTASLSVDSTDALAGCVERVSYVPTSPEGELGLYFQK